MNGRCVRKHEMNKRVTSKTPGSARKPAKPFGGYVVGLGASAGGLEALERFFQGIPADSGAAYVVVQHLSPDHKSMMENLLARHSRIPVATVEDGMPLRGDQIFLIPPGSLMTIGNGKLRLSPKNARGLSLPIDVFFNSLSQAYGSHAVGVVLSGTGSDGTRGAVAINDAGGFLLAQDPETAKFDGMPRSVIATGLVDEILAPESIGARILEHIHQLPAPPLVKGGKPTVPLEKGSALEEILHLLHQLGGVNFRDYKMATVLRRIERRMQVRHVPDFDKYLSLIEGDRGEVITLRREILIPVTSFFRDAASFDLLGQVAIQAIVDERADNQPIRVWVPGASTGEEAYSIAILFAEACDRARRWPAIKIFATDVEQQNIEAAGSGMFSESIAAEVSPERLERFFVRRGSHFVAKNDIRQNIVFARHNLLEDPPFTRMDLVSCRNVLIYFQPIAQERAIRRLQYALVPGGFLFQGSSESLGELQRDFSAVNTKHKIYKALRHVSLALGPGDPGFSYGGGDARHRPMPGRRAVGSVDAAMIDAGQNQLLKSYAPPSLMVTDRHELIHIFGDAQRYLRFGEGRASLDMARLLPERLAPVATALLHKAAKDKTSIQSDVLPYDLPDGSRERIRLVVRPVAVPGSPEQALLLTLDGEPLPALQAGVPTMDVGSETAERVHMLERELAATRESLQATIEELETSNEELQATNEELMASNEELQSTNEELQSVNEELYTVNAENQEKIDILNRLNADLDSMARATGIATLFVDARMCLTRFTPDASLLFKIREGDIGRPLDDFANLLDWPDFTRDLRATLDGSGVLQREVSASNGRGYLCRVLPYQVAGTIYQGAVISFVDVTSMRDVVRLQAILDSLPEHLAVVDAQGTITMVNEAWRRFARANGDPDLSRTGVGSNYLDCCKDEGAADGLFAHRAAAGLRRILQGQLTEFSIEYPCHSATERRWFLMHAAPVRATEGGAVITHANITDWVLNRERAEGR
jgi:two-component system CheB/CheR fusion protein